MVDSDFEKFSERWSAMSEVQRGGLLTDPAIMMAFRLLAQFELDEVLEAMTRHCLANKWMPAPAEIIEHIMGVLPSDESLVGLASINATPLGVFVRSLLGSDVQSMNLRDQCQRIAMHRESISNFVQRAQAGEYTDRDVRLIGGKGIDVRSPLCKGLSGPRKKFHEQLAARQSELVVRQVEADGLPELTPESRKANKSRLKELTQETGL